MENVNEEVIFYIRDIILTNPEVNADVIYSAARLAVEDSDMHALFVEWMKIDDDGIKDFIVEEMEEMLEEQGLL